MKIYSQLLNFQNKLRKVSKDAEGYTYNYASFDNVVNTISSELQSQGLGFTHTFDGQDIICTLFNAEGDAITSKLTLPTEILKGMNASQSMGAAITYARRYTLTAILGLVTDDDTDTVASTPPAKENTSQGQNSTDEKPWLNVNSEQFARLLLQVPNYSPDDLVKMSRIKYKVSKDTEKAIRDSYRDNYEEVQLED
jgi:hypothetical protein